MGSYPRVLHVGFNPIGAANNTGLTLGSMFGAWPADHMFELYSQGRGRIPAASNRLVLPATVAPVDGAVRRALGPRLPSPLADGLNNSVSRRGQSLGPKARARIAATTLNDIGPVVV